MRPLRKEWMSRNLVVLSWVSLFQDTASELLYPILPIFLTSVLGAPVAAIGIMEGLADGAASAAKFVSGRWADRHTRRPLVAAGYGAAAASKLLIAVATVWPLVVIARVVDRLGKGIRGAPRDALIADTTPAEHRGRAFGFHRSIDTWGAVLGPLLGLALYQALDQNIRALLWIATIPAVISVALVKFLREPRRTPTVTVRDASTATRLSPRLRRVIGLLSVWSLVNFPDALLILRARSLGFSVTAVIGVYCVYNLSYALLSYPAGALSDRFSRRIIVGVGLAVFAISYIGLGLTTNAATVWMLFAFYGIYTALTDGVTKAWIIDLAPTQSRGRALGAHQGCTGIATVAAGTWAGFAWGHTGRTPLLIAGIVTAAVAAIILLVPIDRDTKSQAPRPL